MNKNVPSATIQHNDATTQGDEPMKFYPYGHDFGNSEIGGVLIKGKEVLSRSIPTAFTKVDPNAMRNLGVDMDSALIIQVEGEQTSYGVGSIALAQATDPWNGRGDIHRYASSYSLRGLLAVSGSLISDKEYGLLVVTGLPAETYQRNPGLRKDIKKALEGTYSFTIDGGKTMRTVHIEVGATIMEGAGALIAYGGKDKESAQGSGVIDIGGRTTDLYVARGQVPVVEFCKGKPIGVESATQMMMNSFESKHGFPLSPLEARGIMHAFVAPGKRKNYPQLSVFGKPIPPEEIDGLVREAVTQTGEEVVSFVAAAWRQSDSSSAVAARFSPVLNIGGGVFYFFEVLKKRIPHLTRPEEDPVYANARGYAQAAVRLLAKKNAAGTGTPA